MLRILRTNGLCVLLLLISLPVIAEEPAEAELPQLEIVERYSLALDGEVPFDVRWAGPDSVYLVYERSGVFEVDLAEGLPVRRQVFPAADALGFHRAPAYSTMAASDDWLVAAPAGWHIAWREPAAGAGAMDVKVADEKSAYLDFDVDHDRIVLLGLPHPRHYERAPGAIVWLGEIGADGIGRWRPVYESELAAETLRVSYDRSAFRGSIRFLEGGDFVVAPGFSPGVMHFSKTGKLKETWAPEDLWQDAERDGEWVDHDPDGDAHERVQAQLGMLRNRHFIDEVLPHPDGPAIVVRRPDERDGSRYRLGVLGSEIRWFDFPPLRLDAVSAVRADMDDEGRIVILGGARSTLDPTRLTESAVIVLELP